MPPLQTCHLREPPDLCSLSLPVLRVAVVFGSLLNQQWVCVIHFADTVLDVGAGASVDVTGGDADGGGGDGRSGSGSGEGGAGSEAVVGNVSDGGGGDGDRADGATTSEARVISMLAACDRKLRRMLMKAVTEEASEAEDRDSGRQPLSKISVLVQVGCAPKHAFATEILAPTIL